MAGDTYEELIDGIAKSTRKPVKILGSTMTNSRLDYLIKRRLLCRG